MPLLRRSLRRAALLGLLLAIAAAVGVAIGAIPGRPGREACPEPTSTMAVDDRDVARSVRSAPEAGLELRELLAAIAALPGEFRDLLVAVDLVGLSYREAAGLLGAPEDTVATRLFRARRRVTRDARTTMT